MRRSLISLSLVAAACGNSAPAESPTAPTVSTAPTEPTPDYVAPFTADQLRAGIPAGTEMKFRVSAAGQPTVIQHWIFTAADADGCTIHARVLAEDGTTLIEDQGEGTSSWIELASHAHFPATRTTRSDATVEVAAGKFDTWRFVIGPAQPGQPTQKMYFAPALPGPPVLLEVTQGDTLVRKMELLSRSAPTVEP